LILNSPLLLLSNHSLPLLRRCLQPFRHSFLNFAHPLNLDQLSNFSQKGTPHQEPSTLMMYGGSGGSSRKVESAGQRMKSLFQATRGRRLEKQTGGGDIDWNLDLMSMKVEELKEREDESRQDGRGLTGLGIRVLSQKEANPPFKHERRQFPSKGRQDDMGDESDTVSVTSTCPDIDLTPIVDAFPAPPTPPSSSESPSFPSSPKSLYPPNSIVSSLPQRPRSPPRTLTFDYHPQLQHRPSISTISSELTLASTISTNSSVETPSPQTPTVSDMLPAAIPRPNAANLRRVRSFAKPVSVYFSPDRPPALPLPVRLSLNSTIRYCAD